MTIRRKTAKKKAPKRRNPNTRLNYFKRNPEEDVGEFWANYNKPKTIEQRKDAEKQQILKNLEIIKDWMVIEVEILKSHLLNFSLYELQLLNDVANKYSHVSTKMFEPYYDKYLKSRK